jgi:hypothetical protein
VLALLTTLVLWEPVGLLWTGYAESRPGPLRLGWGYSLGVLVFLVWVVLGRVRVHALERLGKGTYSIYLLHAVVFYVALKLLHQPWLESLRGLHLGVYLGAMMPTCLALGMLGYRVVERPSETLRQIVSRPLAPPPGPRSRLRAPLPTRPAPRAVQHHFGRNRHRPRFARGAPSRDSQPPTPSRAAGSAAPSASPASLRARGPLSRWSQPWPAATLSALVCYGLGQLLQPLDVGKPLDLALRSELRALSLFLLWSWLLVLSGWLHHGALRLTSAHVAPRWPRAHPWLNAGLVGAALGVPATLALLSGTKHENHLLSASIALSIGVALTAFAWSYPAVRGYRARYLAVHPRQSPVPRWVAAGLLWTISIAAMALSALSYQRHYHPLHVALLLLALYAGQQALGLVVARPSRGPLLVSGGLSIAAAYFLAVTPVDAATYTALLERPLNASNVRISTQILGVENKPRWFLKVPAAGVYNSFRNVPEILGNGEDDNQL